MSTLFRLIREEQGQDLVEYVLVLAFVVVCSAAMLALEGDSIARIWTITNNSLAAGAGS